MVKVNVNADYHLFVKSTSKVTSRRIDRKCGIYGKPDLTSNALAVFREALLEINFPETIDDGHPMLEDRLGLFRENSGGAWHVIDTRPSTD
jgi:hypothetical protein